MLIHNLHQQLGLAFLIAVCLYAFVSGRRPEKIVAVAMMLAWLASPVAENTRDWFAPQVGIAIVDIALLGVLVALALFSDRYWPLFAASFHGLGVLTHLAFAVDAKIWPKAYLAGTVIWSYCAIVALAVGTRLEGSAAQPSSGPG